MQNPKKLLLKKTVEQRRLLSLLLFNVYLEDIFKQAPRVEDGIKVGETRISNIRYADDAVLISDIVDGLQSILLRVE